MSDTFRLEVKKHAIRQLQDGGWQITIKTHPSDDIDGFSKAPMGARFYTEWVEVDDNEEPVPQKPKPEREPEQAPARARITLAQRAGMLCSNPRFHRYLYENSMIDIRSDIPGNKEVEANAATALRLICGVKSRSEIIPGTPAGQAFEELHAKYTVWLRHPEVA
jgi:hypothetical protein